MYGEYLTHDEQIEGLVKEIDTLRELVVPSRILHCDVCGNKQVMHIEADDVARFKFCPYCGSSIKATYGCNGSFVMKSK